MGWDGMGFEVPGVPARGRRWDEMGFEVPPNPSHSLVLCPSWTDLHPSWIPASSVRASTAHPVPQTLPCSSLQLGAGQKTKMKSRNHHNSQQG